MMEFILLFLGLAGLLLGLTGWFWFSSKIIANRYGEYAGFFCWMLAACALIAAFLSELFI